MILPTAALVGLKLFRVISWGWWTVTAPLWGPWLVCIVLTIWVLVHRALYRFRV